MLTNQDVLAIAMAQSAIDNNCRPEDFLRSEPVVVESRIGPGARVYYREPVGCNFITYGSGVVASAKPELRDIAEAYIRRYEYYHLFETPNALWLGEQIAPLGYKLCFMAEYFLPDMNALTPRPCAYETRILTAPDFAGLYVDAWSNALCADRPERDVLGVGAYDGGELIGLAACSADCESMWQIGVDVLPGYRRRGVAAALTSRLAAEILDRGKVPFYCCAWSNIASARNAVKSGFLPAWAEMTVKPAGVVDGMNGR